MAQSKEFVRDDDRQLVNYLLGVLPEEELERLDEARKLSRRVRHARLDYRLTRHGTRRGRV